jgi:hypothetical protein
VRRDGSAAGQCGLQRVGARHCRRRGRGGGSSPAGKTRRAAAALVDARMATRTRLVPRRGVGGAPSQTADGAHASGQIGRPGRSSGWRRCGGASSTRGQTRSGRRAAAAIPAQAEMSEDLILVPHEVDSVRIQPGEGGRALRTRQRGRSGGWSRLGGISHGSASSMSRGRCESDYCDRRRDIRRREQP